MKIMKYTFDVPVVAMVSHIPAKSRITINYITYERRDIGYTLHAKSPI